MVKVRVPSIYKDLEIIFSQCLETGVFPSQWKEGNIVPIHKKGDRPVSLLPICRKILERLMFNEMFKFFIENKLMSSSQSGFKSSSSCINQLLSITHDIYIYIVLLLKALKLEVYSSILQRHLIRCGMMVSFSN